MTLVTGLAWWKIAALAPPAQVILWSETVPPGSLGHVEVLDSGKNPFFAEDLGTPLSRSVWKMRN